MLKGKKCGAKGSPFHVAHDRWGGASRYNNPTRNPAANSSVMVEKLRAQHKLLPFHLSPYLSCRPQGPSPERIKTAHPAADISLAGTYAGGRAS